MKVLITIVAQLFLLISATAQELTTKNMMENVADLTARIHPRKDINGGDCALVKVQLAAHGASFEGNIIGDVTFVVNEYWVYMAQGSKRLKVRHPNYVPLDVTFLDYGIESLSPKTTYLLTILLPSAKSSSSSSVTQQYVLFRVEPKDAVIQFDGDFLDVVDGTAAKRKAFGRYEYKVKAPLYHSKEGAVTVNDPLNKHVVDIKLSPAAGYLVIPSSPGLDGAKVFVNDDLKGTVPYKSGLMASGDYVVRVAKSMYKHAEKQIVIDDGKMTTYTPSLAPDFANVTLRTTDGGRIYINDEPIGISSWTGRLASGEYKIEIRNDNRCSVSYELSITPEMDGQTFVYDMPKDVTVSLDVITSPADANIFLDGEIVGTTPMFMPLCSLGQHSLRITKPGYKDYTKVIEMLDGKNYEVNVMLQKSFEETPVASFHEYVDLGLSVPWATCNIGAKRPEEKGSYFAWAEIAIKEKYDWGNYAWASSSTSGVTKYCGLEGFGIIDKKNTIDVADDVAYAVWGKNWRMPTSYEFEELKKKCTWSWTIVNGVKGYIVKSKMNDNQIFLPVSGCMIDNVNNNKDEEGFYWSSSLCDEAPSKATDLRFNKHTIDVSSATRVLGCVVRPVFDYREHDYETENGHQYVDLGLSVKWAVCNIGAKSPEKWGDSFSWGETKTKSWYDWSTYFDMKKESQDCVKYSTVSNLINLESVDDVAHTRWGGEWRIPTKQEFNELCEKCIWSYTTLNGVKGYRVQSKVNDNCIFLPFAGNVVNSDNSLKNERGIYWSSSVSDMGAISALGLCIAQGKILVDSVQKMFGASVRPVCP